MLHLPRRQFILIGDSGERDPGLSCHSAAVPRQVRRILIRDVSGLAGMERITGLTCRLHSIRRQWRRNARLPLWRVRGTTRQYAAPRRA
jgi:phosphatidate phosphatase APP1